MAGNTPWWMRVNPKNAKPGSFVAAIERICSRGLAVQFSKRKSGDVVCEIRGKGGACRSTLWMGKSLAHEQDAMIALQRAVVELQTDMERRVKGRTGDRA